MIMTSARNYSQRHYSDLQRKEAVWAFVTNLTLQEEENSSFHQIGIQTLSASSLRHAVVLYVLMAEQSAKKKRKEVHLLFRS